METPKTLPITEPQPSQVLSGFVVSHWQGPHGEHCLVVASAGVCHACRVDPVVRLQPADRVQLQAVALEHQAAPVWEVHVRHLGTQYELVPGQHCRPRTVPAEQWLKEIQAGILPELTAQVDRFGAERSGYEVERQRTNPAGQPELLYATALAMVRREVLGPAYATVCRAAQAAERRSAQAAVALHLHHHVQPNPKTARPSPWDWIRRWRKDHRLRQHLKQARAWQQRAESQRRRLERAANAPDTTARIEKEARGLMETDRALARQLATVAREERSATLRLAAAQNLIQYLQRRSGSLVTLQESLVKGRAKMLPAITDTAGLRAAAQPQTPSIVPAVRTNEGPGSDPAAPLQQPEKTLETPRVQPAWSAQPATTAHAKSNGVRLRM